MPTRAERGDPGRPLRILVVTNLFPSERHPSFGTFVAARVEALRAAGADVEVVANRSPNIHEGVGGKYGRLALAALRTGLVNLAGSRRFDIVEAHIAYPTGWIAWPVAILHRAPLVLFVHGADVIEVARRNGPHRLASRAIFRLARQVVANSRYTANEVAATFPRDAGKVIVRSPGIDLDLFRADGATDGSAAAVEPQGRDGVLFVGRVAEQKGIHVLIEAMRLLGPGAPGLTVIGGGPDLSDVERRAAALDGRISVCGPRPPREVAAAMRRAAVLVVPSVRAEAFGLVAIEGMAAGALVVATRCGGLAESVTDGVTGFVAEPGSSTDLARALSEAVAASGDEVRSRAIREAAAACAADHDVRSIAIRSLADDRTLL